MGTENECSDAHASMAKDSEMPSTIGSPGVPPVPCTIPAGPDYHLRELYEDIFCEAATVTDCAP